MTTPLKFGDAAAIAYRQTLERIGQLAELVRACEQDHEPFVCKECNGVGKRACHECGREGAECEDCAGFGVYFLYCKRCWKSIEDFPDSDHYARAVGWHLAGLSVEEAWRKA